jgi:hypothetical protein
MVNATGAVVPAEVVTVTLPAPREALAAMVKKAVIWVELTTLTLLTVMPLAALTVAFVPKPVPIKVTATAVPRTPFVGAIDVRVGVGEVTARL